MNKVKLLGSILYCVVTLVLIRSIKFNKGMSNNYFYKVICIFIKFNAIKFSKFTTIKYVVLALTSHINRSLFIVLNLIKFENSNVIVKLCNMSIFEYILLLHNQLLPKIIFQQSFAIRFYHTMKQQKCSYVLSLEFE